MSTTEGEARTRPGGLMRNRLIIYAAVLVGVFLLGLLPMWLSAHRTAKAWEAAERNLRLCRLENSLLSAAVDSRRGEYETARASASNFFTVLREQVDLVSGPSDLTPAQREGLRPLLNQRDDLITLLARSDPASADRLAEMYMSFRKGMGNAQP